MSLPLGFEDDRTCVEDTRSTNMHSASSHTTPDVVTDIPAGSTISHSAPWSQVNTRVGATYFGFG